MRLNYFLFFFSLFLFPFPSPYLSKKSIPSGVIRWALESHSRPPLCRADETVSHWRGKEAR